jgi:hypothetical protein
VGILEGEGGGGAVLPRLGAKVVVEAGAGGHGLGVEVGGERAVLRTASEHTAHRLAGRRAKPPHRDPPPRAHKKRECPKHAPPACAGAAARQLSLRRSPSRSQQRGQDAQGTAHRRPSLHPRQSRARSLVRWALSHGPLHPCAACPAPQLTSWEKSIVVREEPR